MRLVSVELEGGDFVCRQSIELGQITALWGVNDAGKSRTLRALSFLLTGGNREGARIAAMRLAVDSDEADELALRSIEGLRGGGILEIEWGDGRGYVSLAAAAPELVAEIDRAETEGAALARWVRFCLGGIGVPEEERAAIAERLGNERILRLDAHPSYGADGMGWSAGWTFRQHGPEDLPDAVISAGLGPIWSGEWPPPIQVPVDWLTVAEALRDASEALGRLALERSEEEGMAPVSLDDARTRALASLVMHAESRMPDFVTSGYSFSAVAGDTLNALPLVLATRRGEDTAFPVADLAQGFHLWVQLAFLELAEAAVRCALVYPELEEWERDRAELASVVVPLVDPKVDPETLRSFAGEIERLGAELFTPAGDVDRGSLEEVVNLGARFFLVDEPEAHLHPAAQREAARWLAEQDERELGRFLIASHSPAFLRLSGDIRLVHVRRADGRQVELRSVDPKRLSALDPEITEIGFDRGELLAMHRAVLFVEGETDRRVLETLYAERIAELGLLILPFRGVGKGAVERVLDCDVLMRVLGPPFYVLVDNCEPALVAELASLGPNELELRRSELKGRQEASFLAKLRMAALSTGRELDIHAIPHRDILGVLDDECIDAVLDRRSDQRRPWPGFSKLVELHGDEYNAKLQEYGIGKDADLFEEVATEMRSRGLDAPELTRVLDVVSSDVRGA